MVALSDNFNLEMGFFMNKLKKERKLKIAFALNASNDSSRTTVNNITRAYLHICINTYINLNVESRRNSIILSYYFNQLVL